MRELQVQWQLNIQNGLKMETDRCPTCHRPKTRSSESNRRYWLFITLIAEKVKVQETYYSRESWHKYFAGKLLGMSDIKLPNGKILTNPVSTADLDNKEFAEYCDRVEAWAAEKNVWLEE
jgi:hypothetical protein